MTARIGYLSALTGTDASSAGGSSAGGGRLPGGDGQATVRPPRRLFGAAGFSGAESGFLEDPSFTDDPGFPGTPGLPEDPVVRPDAEQAPASPAPAGQAAPGLSSRLEPAARPARRSGRTAPGLAAGALTPGPLPGQAAVSATAGPAGPAEPGPGDLTGQFAPVRTGTPAAAPGFLDGAGKGPAGRSVFGDSPFSDSVLSSSAHSDGNKGAASRSAAGAGARAVRAEDGDARPAPPGQPPVPQGWKTADSSPHPGVQEYPLFPPGSAVPRAHPGRSNAAEAPGGGDRPAAAAHQLSPETAGTGPDNAGLVPAPQDPPRRAPGEPWRFPRRGQPRPAHAVSENQMSSASVSAVGVAARPQESGSRRPDTAAGLPPLLPPSARSPGAPLGNSPDSRSPVANDPLPGSAAAVAGTSARSAAPPSAGQPPASPPASPAARPPAASLPTAQAATAAHTGLATLSSSRPAGGRGQAQLTPAVSPAAPPLASRAETSARPDAPALSIGMIEVTLLPPPQTQAPARPTRRDPPQRLSRGLGPRFGQGQV
ncbi:MAG TPA: hypothetical protein VFO01_06405 [Trebonia sp.]|nr:hypothetical protein [Trebonia sp.]